jgi:hypothetical protein
VVTLTVTFYIVFFKTRDVSIANETSSDVCNTSKEVLLSPPFSSDTFLSLGATTAGD